MEARFVTLTAKPGHADALAAFWDEETVAKITAQAGSLAFFILKDTAADTVVALSVWDSHEHAEATGPTFRSHMESVAPHLAAPPNASAMDVAVANPSALIA